jgi:hypothetical protein
MVAGDGLARAERTQLRPLDDITWDDVDRDQMFG